MSHGSLTDAVNSSGQVRCTASWIDSMPGVRCSMHHGQVSCELVMTCSPVRAVEPRVVEDAVMAGMRAGDDRRVVRERDRGQRRHRAVPERDAHVDDPLRRSAPRRVRTCRRARWSWCRRRGSRSRASDAPAGSSTSTSASPSCTAKYLPLSRGAQPSSAAMVGAVSTRRAARGITPSDFTPLPPITIGARACTIPIEPCSPRWPPWSSQLCAAEWITQRSGAAGESKSWAVWSKANG